MRNAWKKRNFGEVYDRPPFVATIEVDVLNKFHKREINPQTKKVETKRVVVEDGTPR